MLSSVGPDLVRRTYDRRARWYDAIVRLLSLGGDMEYRRRAVRELRLRPGQRVLDVGCGTGLNFRLLGDAVGAGGLVVGTDLSGEMLRAARDGRARRVQARASQRLFRPGSFDAALSTYVISTLLDERVVEPIVEAVRPGGRVVIVDDALPPGWFVGPRFMLSNLRRRGWPDLRRETVEALRPHLRNLEVSFCHFGMIFIIAGDRA
jgi:demethylmenaquinone methyltransferase/2-methoxy-6-polyprenyl-1,4-benzoquinol methylase